MRNGPTDFVGEEALDYDEIYRRGGQNCGDEDFALFRCPFCRLPRRAGPHEALPVFNSSFDCVGCGRHIPHDRPWVGPRAAAEFQVTWEQLARSDWAWSVRRSGEATSR